MYIALVHMRKSLESRVLAFMFYHYIFFTFVLLLIQTTTSQRDNGGSAKHHIIYYFVSMQYCKRLLFYTKNITLHKVQMHAGSIIMLLYGFASVREIIHSLKLVAIFPYRRTNHTVKLTYCTFA